MTKGPTSSPCEKIKKQKGKRNRQLETQGQLYWLGLILPSLQWHVCTCLYACILCMCMPMYVYGLHVHFFFDMVLPPQLELSGCLDYQPANPRLCLSLLPHHRSYRYPPLTWVAGDQTQFLKLIQQMLCPLRHRPKVLAIDFADEL